MLCASHVDFKMNAITVNTQGIGFLEPTDILYLYCVDFQFLLDFTITSLPFMELELVGGHVSFPDKLHERRIVLFPNGDIICNLSQQISPCAIEIVTCCHITVRCLLFINYVSGVLLLEYGY
jgi:hypothetical protein